MNLRLGEIRKALVALGGLVVNVAAIAGTNINPATVSLIIQGITSVLVFFIPNQKKAVVSTE